MNDYYLGQYIIQTFAPSIPIIAGAVISFAVSLLVFISIRDGFLPEDF